MVKMTYLAGCLLLAITPAVQAQDDLPEAVRQMIERSQQGSQYEQMARMQMDMQYGAFLNGLTGTPQHRAELEAALLAVLSRRMAVSADVANGRAAPSELQAISGHAYLRAQLAPMLTATELALLDRQGGAPTEAELKREYAAELDRSAPGLTPENHDRVLDVLIPELLAAQGDPAELAQTSVDDLVLRQMQAVSRAGDALQTLLTGEQLDMAMGFLSQLQSNLYRNRAMSEAMP